MKLSIPNSITENGKKIWNRGGNVIDSVLQYLPQPVQELPNQVAEAVSKENILMGVDVVKNKFSSLFSHIKTEDHISMAEEDLPCAYITNIVYDDPFSRPRKVYEYDIIEEHNQIEYCVYRNEKKQKLIVGFRGTEATVAKDYISDVNILLGTHAFNERFQQSLDMYDAIAKEFPEDIKVITGHSLGGTICYMIAQKRNPDRTVVFNPGSSANPTFLLMMKDTQFKVNRTRHVFTYRMLGDAVSTLSVIGYTRTFRKASVNPMELHAVKNFMPIVSPRDITTIVSEAA